MPGIIAVLPFKNIKLNNFAESLLLSPNMPFFFRNSSSNLKESDQNLKRKCRLQK